MKHRKLLAGPYLFWAVSFVIIPLLMIVYYGLTDKEGHFTFSNLGMMTSQENLKALGLALLLSLISTLIKRNTVLSVFSLSAGNDPFRKEYESDEFYRIDLYSPDVDEFPAPYTGMADTA